MRYKEPPLSITADSPDHAGTVVVGQTFRGDMLRRADLLVIDALLNGDPDGTLDVYLQRRLGPDSWADWIHFPQIAAHASKQYSFAITGTGASIVEVGGGTNDSPTPALVAGSIVNVMPGDEVRIVFVAGESTSAGASQTITITPYTEKR